MTSTLPIAAISPSWVIPVVFGIMFWGGYHGVRFNHRKDRFLKALCENHRDVWLAIGSPAGIHWSPPREARNRSNAYSHWAELMSAQEDPTWLPQTPELTAEFREIKAESRVMTYRRLPCLAVATLLCMGAAWALDRLP